ncbi:MAG: hypothetical protein K8R63_05230, partial [Bacteroidales bacterium]|nr:hypothetical protein [Bacteroidales bacterium]
MKRLLLFSLILCIGMVGISQNNSTINNEMRLVKFDDANFDRAIDDATNFYNPVSMIRGSSAVSPSETTAGLTWYDLLGNFNTTANRFWRFEDGTMAAVWTMGFEASAFPGRGTGYNYYDGTQWGDPPTTRIEDIRC